MLVIIVNTIIFVTSVTSPVGTPTFHMKCLGSNWVSLLWIQISTNAYPRSSRPWWFKVPGSLLPPSRPGWNSGILDSTDSAFAVWVSRVNQQTAFWLSDCVSVFLPFELKKKWEDINIDSKNLQSYLPWVLALSSVRRKKISLHSVVRITVATYSKYPHTFQTAVQSGKVQRITAGIHRYRNPRELIPKIISLGI